MQAGGVEGAVGETAGGVDCSVGGEVELCCDDDVELGEVVWLFGAHVLCVDS